MSNDGKYFSYTLEKQQVGLYSLIVQEATASGWKVEFDDAVSGVFMDDNRYFLCMQGDTLSVLDLHTRRLDRMPGVATFKTAKNQQWLVRVFSV